ncbi:MAG: 16S rRNA (uracil(1498)-N(3))-methyltransferase [Gammaproteobacteria bacterium]|nr:16S rRNA (uracil(1498)-N(3))-methyltransferase [Gammaproteobacteria bacterium]
MSTPRLYIPNPLAIGDTFTLPSSQTHHLLHVLRVKPGTSLIFFNGDGCEYEAEFKIFQKQEATVTLLKSRESKTVESRLSIHLGQAMSASDRMDFSVQKAVELGVSTITPIRSSFCQVKLPKERQEKKIAHWQAIAIHAAEQCGRVRVPSIHPPHSFMEWVALPHKGEKLIAHHKGTYPLPKPQHTPESCVIVIGPEGGFSEFEIALSKTNGFQVISLGPRILRTETATVVSLTLLQTLWGDIQ